MVMTVPMVALLGWLVAWDGASQSLRQHRPVAVWYEGQFAFEPLGTESAGAKGLLPVGLELGVQVQRRLLLSAAIGMLPVKNIQTSQATLGGRFYLSDEVVAPYLAAEFGVRSVEVDDTGGMRHGDWFAAAGPGVELTMRRGFSVMTDLLIGPLNVGDETDKTSAARRWHFGAWYRLGVGYRF
jgi:hypothetical protein